MKRLAALTVACFLLAVAAFADVPNRIPYQAILTDSDGTPLTGSFTLTFSIYDVPTGGTAFWSSGPQGIYIPGGHLTYELGSSVTFPDSLFDSSPRFLGITIHPDPELKPRTEITSTMFALRASRADSADGISKNVLTITTTVGGGDSLKLRGDRIELLSGSSGLNRFWLGPASFSLGGQLKLYSTSAAPPSPNPVVIEGRLDGDNAVVFREGSINSFEMWNEPGLAHNELAVANQSLSGSMQDLVTVSITLPEDGYVLLFGRCYIGVSGTTSSEGGYIQIDDGAGGGLESPYYTFGGANGYPSATVTTWWSISTQRVFFRSAGTYTFRLEGQRWTNNGSVGVWNPLLTAVYLPTAYGTVTGTVPASAAAGFGSQTVVTVPADELQGSTQQDLVQVNLAELEHRATQARLKALQAELDARELERKLEEARLERSSTEK